MKPTLYVNSHSVWRKTGFLIQETNRPELYRFADLNPEVSFTQVLSRRDRLRIGLYFIRQAFHRGTKEKS